MRHTITYILGDGIGKEIIPEVIRVVDASGVKTDWEESWMGGDAVKLLGDPLPDVTLDSIKRNRVAIKGPTDTPVGEGYRSVNVQLRKDLDLFAGVRPIQLLPGIKSRYSDVEVDFVIFREGTEDVYGGEEYEVEDGVAEAIKRITRYGSARICRAAFEYALKHGRGSVAAFHKANIMKLTDGLFLESAKKISTLYQDIKFSNWIIDNACMQLVMHPERFDVIVTENLYGDIISDMCAGFVGGLGLIPGANIGDDCAVFEAAHGTAPDIAGKNLANPSALILSAAMMLEHIGETKAAQKVRNAVIETLREGTHVTGDINKINPVSTKEMADAIIKKMENSD